MPSWLRQRSLLCYCKEQFALFHFISVTAYRAHHSIDSFELFVLNSAIICESTQMATIENYPYLRRYSFKIIVVKHTFVSVEVLFHCYVIVFVM